MRAALIASFIHLSWQLCCQDHTGACQPFMVGLKAPGGMRTFAYAPKTKRLSDEQDASDPSSFIGQILSSLYVKNSGYAYIMYNDENPIDGSTPGTKAHQKGVLILSSRSAIWLVHSVPLWPPPPNKTYSFPDPETRYAQSFLCLTLPPDAADSVGEALQTTRPNVYASSFPAPFDTLYPNLAAAATGDHTGSPDPTVISLNPIGQKSNVPFLYFAKSAQWGQDLGESLVSPYYGSAFAWETWQHGVGNLPAYCRGKGGCSFSSYNMAGVSLGGLNWTVTADHSKWGISWMDGARGKPNGSPAVVCVGDINRQSAQRSRGGGTICTEDPNLYAAFADVVSGVQNEDCGNCLPKPKAPKLRFINAANRSANRDAAIDFVGVA